MSPEINLGKTTKPAKDAKQHLSQLYKKWTNAKLMSSQNNRNAKLI